LKQKQSEINIGDLVINKNHIINNKFQPPLAIVLQLIKFQQEEKIQCVKVFVFNKNNDFYVDTWPIMCLQSVNQ